jgi:chromosome partitioning protein
MTTIVIYSRKGGSGKTTTAVSLAAALANLSPTMLVDGDPQGQVTLHFGLPLRSGIYHWLRRELPVEDCLYHGRPEGLRILPGDSYTSGAQDMYKDDIPGLAARLLELPGRYVVVDTGGFGIVIQEAALTVADQVIIPFRPELAHIDGMYGSLEVIKQLAPAAKLTLLPIAFRRMALHRSNLSELCEAMPDHPELQEEFAIPDRYVVPDAVGYGQTIWEYSGGNIVDVRRAYALLASRVLALAGANNTHLELIERMVSRGKAKQAAN